MNARSKLPAADKRSICIRVLFCPLAPVESVKFLVAKVSIEESRSCGDLMMISIGYSRDRCRPKPQA